MSAAARETAVGTAVNPRYKRFHPRWHRARFPIFWWLGQPSYVRFITRELTSLAVAYTALLLVLATALLARGEPAYQAFLDLLRRPPVVALNVVVVCFLLFHTVTWLNLAPRAMVLRLGGRRVPDAVVLAAHYAAWLATSAAVALWLLGVG